MYLLKKTPAGIPQRRQRPVDDEGEPESHAQLGEGESDAPHSQWPSASPLRSLSIPSTAHVPSNKRRRLGNPEDGEGQPDSTASVANHVSPQNSQNRQSQEGASSCGPRMDAGEEVTRININDEEMGFVDAGCRNEYDVRTTANIRNVPSVSSISHRMTNLDQIWGVWKTVLNLLHPRTKWHSKTNPCKKLRTLSQPLKN